jgi:hypothetical protein
MAEEQQVTRRTVTTNPAPGYPPAAGYPPPAYGYETPVSGEAVTTTRVTQSPSTAEIVRRIVVFIFALIQLDIVLRIVLLLVGASADNTIVSFIYTTSDWFVGPFNGFIGTNALHNGGSVLDVAAVVALIGWTILELVILAVINIARREP